MLGPGLPGAAVPLLFVLLAKGAEGQAAAGQGHTARDRAAATQAFQKILKAAPR